MKKKLDRAIALMQQASFLEEQLSRATELRERLRGRELVISVIGQFKRGKSSLLNALLNEDLLPVGIVPLTTAVTEIRRSDSFRAVVRFASGTVREIGRSELPDYISEQKNPRNQKGVAVVKLWTEHGPFGPGITLVDTPGVGSIHQHNTETSYAYVEKSDAVLFLLSVDSPVSAMERDFLLKAREHAAKFYFAVNKTDTISEDNLEEFLSYCRSVLSEAIGLEVTLYPLSAKTGEGVTFLAEKLAGDLRASHDELLAASASIKLKALIAQARAKLALYLKAAAIPAGELKMKLLQIREKQAELGALSDEVHILTKRQTEWLVERLGERLDMKITEMRPQLEGEVERLYRELQALPSRQFEPQLLAGLEGVMDEQLTMLNSEGLMMLGEGYAAIVQALNEKASVTARFVSGLVKEQFELDYPIAVRNFTVSERSDFFIRFGRQGGLLLRPDVFVHLLPRARANRKIYHRAMKQMVGDLDRNKNNMIYNYRYKMQESLRVLCGQFTADISSMNRELDRLLARMEEGHKEQSKELFKRKQRLMLLMQQLEGLR
ncbi:MAG: hypothetical protein GYA86_05865 [Firmicutes bacterium]|nr:hypothetical protein [Bacillota bacterium]